MDIDERLQALTQTVELLANCQKNVFLRMDEYAREATEHERLAAERDREYAKPAAERDRQPEIASQN